MSQEKEITIYDIAETLNISAATVSRGLKNHPSISLKTKKRITITAKELGYRSNNFASNLRKQKTHTIGVLVHELNSNFITSVLSGIEKVTTVAEYDLIIAHSSETLKKEIANAHNLFHKRVDGLIASLSFDTENMDHFEPFFERGIPVVFFDRVEEKSKGTKVVIDNYMAGYEATAHLIEQGCKRIVHTTSNLKRNVYARRYQGYRAALKDNNIAFDDTLLFINDLKKESCIAAANVIAAMNPLPDGIFTTNDLTAALCIQTLKEKGIRIPEDVAIVGFNNDTVSIIVEPKLTTINYPGIDMGEVAATHLINQLQGGKGSTITSSIVLKSDLIIRQSSLKKGR